MTRAKITIRPITTSNSIKKVVGLIVACDQCEWTHYEPLSTAMATVAKAQHRRHHADDAVDG